MRTNGTRRTPAASTLEDAILLLALSSGNILFDEIIELLA
jgi:hypothetical protein